jgi:beta-lactamase regulating signal transducer with metallopeptidase domain
VIEMVPILMHWVESMSGVAAGAFVSGMWQGLVLAAGVWLCLQMIPRITASVRFLVWGAVFVVLAMLPVARSAGWGGRGTVAGYGAIRTVHVDVRWGFAIAALWAAFSLVRGAKLVMSAVRLRKIWKRATPVEMGVVSGLLKLGATLSAKDVRGVKLCTSADVDCPSVIGFFSPHVLIPAELFDRLTVAELEQIVLHELGHLRRADDWINLLQKIGLMLFPLNPALLWIEQRLCFERELACDEDVLRLTRAPKAYATCLTTLAERGLARRAAALTLGAWERQSELSRRVYSILRWRDGMGRATSTAKVRVAMCVMVLGLAGGTAELARCPQLVSFSRVEATPMIASAVAAGPVRLAAGNYQPVAFDAMRSGHVAQAHETLLKASMPMGQLFKAVGLNGREQARRSHRSVVQRVKRSRGGTQQMVVLTSWSSSVDGSSGAHMVMTVARGQSSFSSYAALPTAGGWLIFQL